MHTNHSYNLGIYGAESVGNVAAVEQWDGIGSRGTPSQLNGVRKKMVL